MNEKIIDSHCHLNGLDLTEFNNNLETVLEVAKTADVVHMLCVCVEATDVPTLYDLANKFSQVSISVGIHPNISLEKTITAEEIIQWAKHPSCIAIGETGLDYYRCESETEKNEQQNRFRNHITAAKKTVKPLIIHTRQAADDTLKIMQEESAHEIGGVMHCFTENWEVAKNALDMDFYISFSGIITFKNALVIQEVAKKVPLNRILIETDSPYLAPVPFRGKQNHPALVKYVAMMLSELRNESYATIAKATTENFYRCFKVVERA